MRYFLSAIAVAVIAVWALVGANAASPADVKAAVEGIYVLEEWHADGKVFRPPQVAGRVVYLNGTFVAILENKADESKQTTSALFGTYSLQPDSFGYRFDERGVFTETPNGVTASHALPFEGMRSFDVVVDGSATALRSRSSDEAVWSFTPDGFTYAEHGQVLRAYRRVKPE
jgi:hypothetical protein